jgi:GT2 family glycosyltransferase
MEGAALEAVQAAAREKRAVDAARAPVVTAIVLNWCGEADTAACLRSLAAGDYPALRVLLVDNGSPDGSGDKLHAAFPETPYLQTGTNLGYTGGNNRGMELALEDGCDYVLVLNNDTVAEPDCVSRLVAAARSRPRVGAVGPKILYADEPDRIWFAGGDLSRTRALGTHRREGERDDDASAYAGPEEVTFLTGCCLLIPADVVREVGGFEEDFFAYAEDVDLSLRLAERGYSLLYEPRARLLHRISPTEQPSPFGIRHATRNRRRLARRRFTAAERVRFALFFYPTRLIRAAGYLLSGDRPRARAVWDGAVSR